jgi:hypothetical protein
MLYLKKCKIKVKNIHANTFPDTWLKSYTSQNVNISIQFIFNLDQKAKV